MEIKKAVEAVQKAQRNYDLSKTSPQEDLDTLIYAATNSPSKQNETHYSLHVYTDQDIIRQIYNHTKKFTMIRDKEDSDKVYTIKNNKYVQNDTNSVTNSQILANALFVYVKEEGQALGGTHKAGKENPNSNANQIYNEQIAYSMGVSVGELILTAGLLGYKTGICSALDTKPIRNILRIQQNPKLLVGVGYPDTSLDRKQHAELLNADVPEKFRTGDSNDHWQFPSFVKYTKVKLNNEDYDINDSDT